MYIPAVITYVITFTLDEILKAIIPHVTIKNILNLILILTSNNHWGWRSIMSMTGNRVRECWG
jgi:hypothetical protein